MEQLIYGDDKYIINFFDNLKYEECNIFKDYGYHVNREAIETFFCNIINILRRKDGMGQRMGQHTLKKILYVLMYSKFDESFTKANYLYTFSSNIIKEVYSHNDTFMRYDVIFLNCLPVYKPFVYDILLIGYNLLMEYLNSGSNDYPELFKKITTVYISAIHNAINKSKGSVSKLYELLIKTLAITITPEDIVDPLKYSSLKIITKGSCLICYEDVTDGYSPYCCRTRQNANLMCSECFSKIIVYRKCPNCRSFIHY